MKGKTTKKSSASAQNASYGVEESALMHLMVSELKDIYWAEKALVKALPKMAKKATSEELVEAIESHLSETEGQVSKLEQVFELLEMRAVAKKCEAMAGLLKEGDEMVKESEEGGMRDAAIISAAQKVEHYEIATYGTLRTFAETLGLEDVASIFEEILDEEKSADEKLTEIAVSTINIEAAEEVDAEEEEE